MDIERVKTNSSLLSSFGLALLGTTCCALPIALVAVGLGGVVASLLSALPWLVWLSQYKAITFSLTALLLAYSGWRLHRGGQCDVDAARQRRWQQRFLALSTVLFSLALFAAYALLPITRWLESS